MAEETTSPEEAEVHIIERKTVTIYPTLTEEKKVKRITFSTPTMPPQTIEIPLDEYSPEVEDAKIRQAIKEFKAQKPEIKRIKL